MWDYDYYYDDYYEKPDYSSIREVTEWMSRDMCCGIGLREVAFFLDSLRREENDSIAAMYRAAILAEYNSSLAKYASGSYKMKEEYLGQLIRLCDDWKKNHIERIPDPELDKQIEELQNSDVKKKARKLNKLKKRLRYFFPNESDRIAFKRGYSDIYVAPYIFYFELPGCEQISFHSALDDICSNDDIEWDGKRDSTLLKLQEAVFNRYGDKIIERYQLSEDKVSLFREIVNVISKKYENEFSRDVHMLLNVFSFEEDWKQREEIINNLKTGRLFRNAPLSEITSSLVNSPEEKLCAAVLKCCALASKLAVTNEIVLSKWNDCLISEFDAIKDICAEIQDSDFISFKENDYAIITTIKETKYIINKKPDITTENFEFFDLESLSDEYDKLQLSVLMKYGPTLWPELYDAYIKAEEEKQRKILEEKEKERKEKLERLSSHDYLTKSVLKEYYFWTDTLINKFAGEPDKHMKNPNYRSADPMCLYLKTRILEIEKQPEFIEELKKSFKRRKLEWNFENDIITHEF